MENPVPGETREQVTKWIEEGQHLLGLLPGLLDEIEQLRAKAAAADRECERLRQEMSGLQSEKAEAEEALKKLKEVLQPVTEVLQKPGVGQKKSPFRPA